MAVEETIAQATGRPAEAARFWHDQIQLASKTERDWREKRAPKVVERYRDEKRESGTRLNIFWSNVQLLKPSVYSQRPSPDVRRRNVREEEGVQIIGRQVAEVLERCLSFSIDDGFDRVMKSIRDDVLIPGRGVAREIYEPEIVEREAQREIIPGPDGEEIELFLLDGFPVEPDRVEDERAIVEQVVDERVTTAYVFWSDFRMSPARRWEDVWWIAFRHAMTRDELVDEFDEAGRNVPLALRGDTSQDKGAEREPADPESTFGRAEVWEVWNKRKRERVWIATGHESIIRKDDDPMRLAGFFPCPPPLYVIETTDQMVPIPEFTMYQDQADELDEIQSRLTALNEIVRAVAFVDGDFTESSQIKNSVDGDMIPVNRPGAAAEDLARSIWPWPIQNIVASIQILSQRAEQVKQGIFEITGLSDLSRGITQPRVSASAEQAKTRFGAVRMTPRSEPMQSYIRDLLRIKAEVMAEMFQPETLARQSGIQVTPEMTALMREERLRNVVIDVESDSTVQPDAQADKAEAIEFVQSVTQFFESAVPLATAAPAITPFLFEMLQAATRPFKFGRQLEDSLQQASDAATGAAQQAQQAQQQAGPQQPTAEEQKKIEIMEREQQIKEARFQIEAAGLQAKQALEARESAAKQDRADRESEAKIALERQKAASQANGAENRSVQ